MLPCLALGVALLAADGPPATPPPHTFTATMANRVDAIGRRVVRERFAPGLAIAIVEDGRIVYAHGFGFSDQSRHRTVQPETEFYTGMLSKPFTAAALLLLAQDGKLKLDDKIVKYVPELSVAGNATVIELLQQTAGLPNPIATRGSDMTRTVKITDLIASANKMPSTNPAGEKFARNPFDYMIAGLIAERVSGIPLSDYLQQYVFEPLVMNHTFLAGDRGISPAHAVGYTGSPGRFAPAHTWDPAWLFGSRDIVSNVYDIAKWDIGLPLLLRVDAERIMFTPGGADGQERAGLGWIIDQRDGKRYIWQNGEIPGYLAMNAMLPDDNIAVIVLENTDRYASKRVAFPETIASEILDIVLPPTATHVGNAVMEKAREWLARIAEKRIDRTQLTAAFSAYLTDRLVAQSNFAALGKPQALVPVASTSGPGSDTTYEFLVRFPHEQWHYKLSLTPDGKIDGLVLTQ